MWLPAYVTTIWYSSHHRCAECTRAGIAKYIHPYVVPCQWSIPGCRLDGSVVDMQRACLLCAGIFWPFSGSLPNKDTLIQLEPDQATPLLTRSYWRDTLVRNLLRTFLHCIRTGWLGESERPTLSNHEFLFLRGAFWIESSDDQASGQSTKADNPSRKSCPCPIQRNDLPIIQVHWVWFG